MPLVHLTMEVYNMSSLLRVIAVSICLGVALASPAPAQETGRIAGVVKTSEDGSPLGHANVMVIGSPFGAAARSDGRFILDNIPPGTYTVAARMMGYEGRTQENVVVRPWETTELEFRLEKTVVMTVETVEVRGKKKTFDVDQTGTTRLLDLDDIGVTSVNTLDDALIRLPGVVLQEGEIHVRGGRAGETKRYVDGMLVSEFLVANTELTVGMVSLANVEVLTGGFDAEYGNVQSGVVNMSTREGGSGFSGLVKFMTDDFGAPDKTYFNYDNLALGLGGPLPGGNLRLFASGEVSFSDTYLETREPRSQRELWGFVKFRERQTNAYSGQAKLTYSFTPLKKLSGEILASGGKYDRYNHPYSRIGYWSGSGEHWWYEPLDSTYSLYVGPSHTPDVTNQHRSVKLVWNHTLGPTSFYTLRLGHFDVEHKEVVLGKSPAEYEIPTLNDRLDPENRYFVVDGDYPHWQRYHTTMLTAKGDMTVQRLPIHEIKFGAETNIYRLEMKDIYYPSQDQPLGSRADVYKFHCWGMSAFLQDRIQLEGMNLRAGLRCDLFDPGSRAVGAYNDFLALTGFSGKPTGFFGRIEWQISPRLGISYPVSERDAIYFNYGRFYQIPRLEVLYQSMGHRERGLMEFGNPLMDAETTVMYEIGIQHQFTQNTAGDIAMFYKDIFGLAGTEAARLAESSAFIGMYGPTAVPIVYVNMDYGSVRGIELSLRRRFSNHFSGSLTYTFSKATGSSSNELQGSNVASGAMDRAPITELPLNWDQNHVVAANLRIGKTGLWGCSIDWTYAGGAPYTPAMPRERQVSASLINSERLPSRSVLDIKADKVYRIAGQEVSLFVEGKNVLDRMNLATLEPGTWPAGGGNYVAYYTTEGEMGGAYDRGELLGLSDIIYVPLNDPRVYSPPRNFRVGISFDW
jgi:outer membrane receptor protein involved in Fe transport